MRVTVCDVGPRDGLQNETEILPVAARAQLISRLAAAGVPRERLPADELVLADTIGVATPGRIRRLVECVSILAKPVGFQGHNTRNGNCRHPSHPEAQGEPSFASCFHRRLRDDLPTTSIREK